MSFNSFVRAAAAAFVLSGAALAPALAPAWAGDMAAIKIEDPYIRSSTAMSTSGAAFMVLMNHGDKDDRMVAAASDIAERVELHTHIQDANGVMRMVEVEDGFAVPAGGMRALQRGGDHVMFMGLRQPLEQGQTINVTLTFEHAGDIAVEIPVDLERKPMHGMQHGTMSN